MATRKYTPNAGIPELREAAASKVRKRNGIHTSCDQVIITPGAIAALHTDLTDLYRRIFAQGPTIELMTERTESYIDFVKELGEIPAGRSSYFRHGAVRAGRPVVVGG